MIDKILSNFFRELILLACIKKRKIAITVQVIVMTNNTKIRYTYKKNNEKNYSKQYLLLRCVHMMTTWDI